MGPCPYRMFMSHERSTEEGTLPQPPSAQSIWGLGQTGSGLPAGEKCLVPHERKGPKTEQCSSGWIYPLGAIEDKIRVDSTWESSLEMLKGMNA